MSSLVGGGLLSGLFQMGTGCLDYSRWVRVVWIIPDGYGLSGLFQMGTGQPTGEPDWTIGKIQQNPVFWDCTGGGGFQTARLRDFRSHLVNSSYNASSREGFYGIRPKITQSRTSSRGVRRRLLLLPVAGFRSVARRNDAGPRPSSLRALVCGG